MELYFVSLGIPAEGVHGPRRSVGLPRPRPPPFGPRGVHPRIAGGCDPGDHPMSAIIISKMV